MLAGVAALAGLAARRVAWPAEVVVGALGLSPAPRRGRHRRSPSSTCSRSSWRRSPGCRGPLAAPAAAPGRAPPRSNPEPSPRGTPRGDAEPDAATGAVTRRGVLHGSAALGVVGAAAVVAGGAGQLLGRGVGDSRAEVTRLLAAAPVTPAPPVPPGADLTAFGAPPVITSNADFYRIDAALRVPALARRTGRCGSTAWSTASSRSPSPTCSPARWSRAP